LVAPALASDLTRLGRWYGTDKASAKHQYTKAYERYFSHLRSEPIRLLEIGIGGYHGGPMSGGGSLRMWRTWLRHAEIVGVDLDPRSFDEPRITTFAGDQTDEAFLQRLVEDQGPFDVVIDDGSHVSAHVLKTWEVIWPLLPSGGTYVIEDLACAYDPAYGGGPPGTPGTPMELVRSLVDETQVGEVAELHLYRELVILVKR
jgi:cephalosporin hydroxylase